MNPFLKMFTALNVGLYGLTGGVIGGYNQKRMHSSIDYKTPVDAESSLMTA